MEACCNFLFFLNSGTFNFLTWNSPFLSCQEWLQKNHLLSGNGKNTISNGRYFLKGLFSIVMLVYRGVNQVWFEDSRVVNTHRICCCGPPVVHCSYDFFLSQKYLLETFYDEQFKNWAGKKSTTLNISRELLLPKQKKRKESTTNNFHQEKPHIHRSLLLNPHLAHLLITKNSPVQQHSDPGRPSCRRPACSILKTGLTAVLWGL